MSTTTASQYHTNDQSNGDIEKHSPSSTHDVRDASFLARLEHFTWAWFTLTMSAGSLAIVLSKLPFRFKGLDMIGTILYLLNLTIFALFSSLISIRFLRYRWTLRASLLHPTESLFVSTVLLSFGTLIIGAQAYAGSWVTGVLRVLFWLYCAVALVMTVGMHIVIWSTQTHTVYHMTPLWILPIYPALLVAPMAGALAPHQPKGEVEMVAAGVAFQGIGFMVAVMVYSAYISRLMTAKLPIPPARPGMFISVGPSAFTSAGLITLGRSLPASLISSGSEVGKTLEVISLFIGVWLWGLAGWFLLISVAANAQCIFRRRLHFNLGWWGFVFPNTAFVLATFAIGDALDSYALNLFGTIITVVLVFIWVFVMAMTVRGILKRQVLWKDRGEDREEGGFKRPQGDEQKSVHPNQAT